jgi:pantoate--beta-alanine ligase
LIVARSIAEFPVDHAVSTGFVPTMGALHEGHLSLIRQARANNERVVVSIFVNPTQFGPNEDFSRYPRPFERDCELAQSAGADVVFAPQPSEMYPDSPSLIHVPVVTEYFEGAYRPGHFDGVATIVSKLFNIVVPNRAYFGLKDLQQCAVIRKMVTDFNHRVELIFAETLREDDGLAKSSRNVYLSEEERAIAPLIYGVLQESRTRLRGHIEPKTVVSDAVERLDNAGFKTDYLDLVNWDTMRATETIDDKSYLVVATRLGKTRLIDNLRVIW